MTVPAALQADLDSGSSSVVNCFLVRHAVSAAVLLAVTEHDEDLVVDGVTYKANGAMSASAARAELGGAVSSIDVEGAFSDDGLDASDLKAGVYDGAEVFRYVVYWKDPTIFWLHSRYYIGAVTHTGEHGLFEATLDGLETKLQSRKSRSVSSYCPLDLGEPACGADLTLATRRNDTTITDLSDDRLVVKLASFGAVPTIGMRYGRCEILSGVLAGLRLDVASATSDGRLVLFTPVPTKVEIGAYVRITVGCDKLFSTCVSTFGRARFFQGFPDVPTADSVIRRFSFGDAS